MAYSRIDLTVWIKGDQQVAGRLLRNMLAPVGEHSDKDTCILVATQKTVKTLQEVPDAIARIELNGGKDVFGEKP